MCQMSTHPCQVRNSDVGKRSDCMGKDDAHSRTRRSFASLLLKVMTLSPTRYNIILLLIVVMCSCYPDQSCPEYPKYESKTANDGIRPAGYLDELCSRRQELVTQINAVDCPAAPKMKFEECGFTKQ